MSNESDIKKPNKVAESEVTQQNWGEIPDDNFGYASDEERRAKRGLEDWELVEKVPASQRGVPKWFIAVVVAVLLIAVGLSFPFWGNRPGHERPWIDWGFGAALAYILVFGAFVYFMVNHYSPDVDGTTEDSKSDESASPSVNDKTSTVANNSASKKEGGN